MVPLPLAVRLFETLVLRKLEFPQESHAREEKGQRLVPSQKRNLSGRKRFLTVPTTCQTTSRRDGSPDCDVSVIGGTYTMVWDCLVIHLFLFQPKLHANALKMARGSPGLLVPLPNVVILSHLFFSSLHSNLGI